MERVELLTYMRKEKNKNSRNQKEYLKKHEIFLMVLSFLFARCNIFNISPFATAYLSSHKKRDYLFYSLSLFAIFGVVSTFNRYLILKYVMSICLITIIGLKFNNNTYVNAASCSVSILISGIISSIIAKYPPIYILFSVIESILSFGLTILFDMFNQSISKKEHSKNDAAILVILFLSIAILGIENVYDKYLDFKKVLFFLLIYIIAFNQGMIFSTSMGFIIGFLDSIKSYTSLENAVIFSFTSLMAGLLKGLGKLGISIGAISGYIISTLYISSSPSIKLREIILSSILFVIFPFENIRFMSKEEGYEISPLIKEKINGLAQIIENLNQKKESSNEILFIGRQEAKKLIENVTSETCSNCISYPSCWDLKLLKTIDNLKQIREIIEKKGYVEEIQWLKIMNDCIKGKEFLAMLNGLLEGLKYSKLVRNNYAQKEKGLNAQLEIIKEIIVEAAKYNDNNLRIDYGLSKEIEIELSRFGYNVNKVEFVEHNKQFYCQINIDEGYKSPRKYEIENIIKSIVADEIEIISEIPRIEGGYEITLIKKPPVNIDYAIYSKAKNQISGDRVCFMQLKSGQFISCISDGMGTGKSASESSFIVIDAIKKFLALGFKKEHAVIFINSLFNIKADEEFASIDLLSIDRYNKEIEIIKMGAMPTFIKKGFNVLKFSSNSLACGIELDSHYNYYKSSIAKGDMIFMVSDGVIEALGENGEEKISSFISQNDFISTSSACKEIINFSMQNLDRINDDMTAVSLKITGV